MYQSLILHSYFIVRTYHSLCFYFGSSKGRTARREVSAFFRHGHAVVTENLCGSAFIFNMYVRSFLAPNFKALHFNE